MIVDISNNRSINTTSATNNITNNNKSIMSVNKLVGRQS